MHVKEVATRMAPARDFDQRSLTGWRYRFVELGKATVAIRMQESAIGAEQRFHVDALAVRRVTVECRWRYCRSPWPLVPHGDPEVAGLGLSKTGGKHRNRCVIRMQSQACPDVAPDSLGQRSQQEHGLTNPIGER